MTDEELELFPTSESALKMLSYVTPGFYDKSYVAKWMYQVMGLEYDTALKLAEELPLQFFPETGKIKHSCEKEKSVCAGKIIFPVYTDVLREQINLSSQPDCLRDTKEDGGSERVCLKVKNTRILELTGNSFISA